MKYKIFETRIEYPQENKSEKNKSEDLELSSQNIETEWYDSEDSDPQKRLLDIMKEQGKNPDDFVLAEGIIGNNLMTIYVDKPSFEVTCRVLQNSANAYYDGRLAKYFRETPLNLTLQLTEEVISKHPGFILGYLKAPCLMTKGKLACRMALKLIKEALLRKETTDIPLIEQLREGFSLEELINDVFGRGN